MLEFFVYWEYGIVIYFSVHFFHEFNGRHGPCVHYSDS